MIERLPLKTFVCPQCSAAGHVLVDQRSTWCLRCGATVNTMPSQPDGGARREDDSRAARQRGTNEVFTVG